MTGETVETVIEGLEIADLLTETITEVEEVGGDTRQGLNHLHRVDIDLQATTELKTNLL